MLVVSLSLFPSNSTPVGHHIQVTNPPLTSEHMFVTLVTHEFPHPKGRSDIYLMPNETALLVIDMQVGLFEELDSIDAGEGLLHRVQRLITKARAAGCPVVYVQHNEGAGEPLETNTPAWSINPAIYPVDGDAVVQKFTPDAFYKTNLQDELRRRGVTKLLITGMQTNFCVDATSHRAHNLGYEVLVVEDAHNTGGQGGRTAEEIVNQYNETFRSFAKVVPSDDIVF